ncbi:LON peptidase substrate-binding domain-containing protein [Microvirga lotononidis]|uniref:Peptidase S16, lon domain protein n=1 Tax=Microvirga lotononidis TaxID=864069 RepID=I4YZH6_9HYPH|nr:LON peptidase substrate-binding domain-containing protein [Microvirga lotononidis]EIM29368.1 peptidase S16, lon domain protein [Microvirga lotononidis]WQO29193.1 LON peptidase substrate-binding domain-containing protein [Microvirga lotononidis]
MGMNAVYRGPEDCPSVVPVFPLPGALLLPRGQMPLNIFEPRYLAMVDEALKTDRIIGMVQPDADNDPQANVPKLYRIGCAGRITQFAETGDGRYLITLIGIARFRIEEELPAVNLFRQCRVAFEPFANDFVARAGENAVNRAGVVKALRDFVNAVHVKVDWRGIEEAPNEALVNALCMMSPFGVREKQALLEASDLKSRAEVLIALTEIELARGGAGSDSTLQ